MLEAQTEQKTTNTYASLLKVRVLNVKVANIVISNSHSSNSLTYRVLVSNDPLGSDSSFAPLELNSSGDKELALSHGVAVPFDLRIFVWVDLQVKSTLPDNPATANAWLHAH